MLGPGLLIGGGWGFRSGRVVVFRRAPRPKSPKCKVQFRRKFRRALWLYRVVDVDKGSGSSPFLGPGSTTKPIKIPSLLHHSLR